MPTESARPALRSAALSAALPAATLLAFALGGCAAPGAPWEIAAGGGASVDGPGDPALAAIGVTEPIANLPKSRRGNMAEYTVRGKRYRTLDSAAGFRERGVASWYGAKFHGRDTSSGEPFDMHAMTAAHRQLPLPTFVRVTDVASGRSVVVKVNDRGPFADDRVIDLSYAAASRLGMLERGTAEVTLEALSTHVEAPPPASPVAARAAPAAPSGPARLIQLGAFGDGARAHALARRAARHLDAPPRVVPDPGGALWRVRAGPFDDDAAVAAALAALASGGIDDYTLVAATPR